MASTWDGTGATHTFLAYTTGHDIVTAASVVVPNAAGALNLVGICVGPEPTPQASLQDAATSPSQPGAPVLIAFGILLAALGSLAGLRVVASRAER